MLGKRQITHGIPAIAAIALLLGLTVLGLPSTLAQQNTPTPTVPVQTVDARHRSTGDNG